MCNSYIQEEETKEKLTIVERFKEIKEKPTKTTEIWPFKDLVDKTTQIRDSKSYHTSKPFINNLKTLIKMYILILRSNGLSYGKIEKASGIATAQIFRIEKDDWFPKKPVKQQEICDRLAKLVEIKVLI